MEEASGKGKKAQKLRRRFNPAPFRQCIVKYTSEAFAESLQLIRDQVIAHWETDRHLPHWATCCKVTLRAQMGLLGHPEDKVISFAEIMTKNGLHSKEDVIRWIASQCQLPSKGLAVIPGINIRHPLEKSNQTSADDLLIEELEIQQTQEQQEDVHSNSEIESLAYQDMAYKLEAVKDQLHEYYAKCGKANRRIDQLEGELNTVNDILLSERETYQAALNLLRQENQRLKKSCEKQGEMNIKLFQEKSMLSNDIRRQNLLIKDYHEGYHQLRQQLKEKDSLLGKRCTACNQHKQTDSLAAEAVSLLIAKQSLRLIPK